MSKLVPPSWVHQQIDSADYLILDPRRPMKYLQGHVRNAVNLSASHAFDKEGALRPVNELATWIGAAGLDAGRHPVLYDNYDGRNAALVAWILEYLGRDDVYVMDTFFEKWGTQGYEMFYRPVDAKAAVFEARPNAALRAVKDDARAAAESKSLALDGAGTAKLVDFRAAEEFAAGHIPGALHFSWQTLVAADRPLPAAELSKRLQSAGVMPGDSVIAYCQSGLRASLGYLLLSQMGMKVRLYDGSYNDWSKDDKKEIPQCFFP